MRPPSVTTMPLNPACLRVRREPLHLAAAGGGRSSRRRAPPQSCNSAVAGDDAGRGRRALAGGGRRASRFSRRSRAASGTDRAISSAAAAKASVVRSWRYGPTICTPTGRPDGATPTGITVAGRKHAPAGAIQRLISQYGRGPSSRRARSRAGHRLAVVVADGDARHHRQQQDVVVLEERLEPAAQLQAALVVRQPLAVAHARRAAWSRATGSSPRGRRELLDLRPG